VAGHPGVAPAGAGSKVRTPRRRRESNPADRVLRARVRESVRFPDLTERLALKLAAVPNYTARAHFGLWHRRFSGPDFSAPTGVFTPLYFVDFATSDVALNPQARLLVRGATRLARAADHGGNIRHLLREGSYTVFSAGVDTPVVVARARLINVFTRNDPDAARRRVTVLPEEMGIGNAPSRRMELPTLETLLPLGRAPDFAESSPGVWHYGQTDPNRHVTGLEYLRTMECFAAAALAGEGRDMARFYFARARILYRKPCFRGERYRRAAWRSLEGPLVIAGAFYKGDDPPGARPAVAVELTLAQHDAVR
jgi:hypothetical protein